MATIIRKEHLQNGILFQGKDYGDIPISFFWMQLPPDGGPTLHYHPYDEIFLVLEGRATFTVGESTVEVEAGSVVIGPAGVPHKFSQMGEDSLRIVTIHPSPRTIGTRGRGGKHVAGRRCQSKRGTSITNRVCYGVASHHTIFVCRPAKPRAEGAASCSATL